MDLAGYTSGQSADDINDLRVALGLDKISLFGFSYGTHLALATIRRHGEHIENAILMGVEGPNHTFKLPLNMDYQFERISQMAAKDPSISPHIGNLLYLYDKVIEKLKKKPMMVEVEGPSGEKLQIPVGPFGLNAILRFDMGDASDIPVFPKLLHSIYHDDPSILSWFVNKRTGITMGINAMATMMDGASGATEDRLAQIRLQAEKSRFGNIMNIPFMSSDVISFPDLGDEYRSPLLSDVRTLFISGSLDWNTPPFQAEEVRWGFPDSYHIRVRNAGHEQMLPHPKVQQAMMDFLKGEDVSQLQAEWPDIKFVPIDRYDKEVTHPSVARPN